MSYSQRIISAIFAFVILATIALAQDAKPAWPTITPDELALKDDPAAPGAAALALYREYIADDVNRFVGEYLRIKVLNDEGRKYGDIEITYYDDLFAVDRIEARVTRPDGTSAIFHGTIHDKVLIRTRSFKLLAKTFSLPDVAVGSIIEYRYRLVHKPNVLMSHHWEVQSDLFTRRAHFELRPVRVLDAALVCTYRFMPESKRVQMRDGFYVLDVENIPGLQTETLMPPPAEVRMGVDLVYRSSRFQGLHDLYWSDSAKRFSDAVDEFVGKNNVAKAEVARLVTAADSEDVKLRKLYARAQQIRNTDYDADKTEKELKRQKLKENKNADDTLTRGYGRGSEITLAFIAMARAAGFESGLALIATRARQFFHSEILSTSQMDSYLAWVEIAGKTKFLDPAMRFCPYGIISWDQTGSEGIRGVSHGNVFVKIPSATAAEAITRRTGNLRVLRDGSLEGDLSVSWTGLEALERRTAAFAEDEAGRRNYLEDNLKSSFPDSTRITVNSVEGWANGDVPLVATISVKVPSYASVTGRRLMLSPVATAASAKPQFLTKIRKQALILAHPYREEDDFVISAPDGFELENLPQDESLDDAFMRYSLSVKASGQGAVHVSRIFELREWNFPVTTYGRLRVMFEKVQAADSEPLVLSTTSSGVAAR